MISNGMELIYVVVNYGQGSKVLNKAIEFGALGGNIFYGLGSVKNKFLNFLSLYDERKEIVIILAIKQQNKILNNLCEYFKFNQSHKGIAFNISLARVVDSHNYRIENYENIMEDNSVYRVIFVVVNKGFAEDVIDSASNAGAKGGTIINGRGSGVSESSGLLKLFNVDIEPEKEMVMILVKKDICERVVEKIGLDLEIEKPGHGIMFVQDVSCVLGLYDKEE